MLISTRGTYALRILVELARGGEGEYICLGSIAAQQGISRKYLDQIVPELTRSGIVETCRGSSGGIRLAKRPEEISAADILRATEGSLAPVTCLQSGCECERCDECPAHPVWKGLEDVIESYLSGKTLRDISERDMTEGEMTAL